MAAVDDGQPAPPELQLYWWCDQYKTLPEAGGVMEQDYILMTRMSIAANVYGVLSRYRGLVGDSIHSLSNGERRMLRYLRDAGVIDG